MWIVAAAGAGITLPAISRGAIALPWSFIMVLASAWLALKATALLYPATDPGPYRRAFVHLNLFGLIIVACLLANALMTPAADAFFQDTSHG